MYPLLCLHHHYYFLPLWCLLSLSTYYTTHLSLSLGPTYISYVADSGEETLRHGYDSVLRYSKGMDNVSFGYIVSSNGKAQCHVFQSLAIEEVCHVTLTLL